MATYDFTALSPIDFEDMCGDLLQRFLTVSLSRYKPGKDLGIDLGSYSLVASHGLVVQCKHYVGSGYRSMLRDLKDVELPKIKRLHPDRYVVATSVPLNPMQKMEISEALAPFIQSTEDVFGQHDLNALLGDYPEVERRHFKLWLSSTTVLERILNAATYERSVAFFEELDENVRRFVASDAAERANRMLNDRRVCAISGVPGIGKTLLAQVICAGLSLEGFEVIVVSSDITEAEQAWRPGAKQVFYYDDFLGTATLEESLGKNEDGRLMNFIRRVERTQDKRLILTTREYILAAARQRFAQIGTGDLELLKVTIDIGDYTTAIRAQILFNHLWFSDAPAGYLAPFLDTKKYWPVIQHANYSPRLVAMVVGLASREDVDPEEFGHFFVEALSNPTALWEHTYETQLPDLGRASLLALLTLGTGASVDSLEASARQICQVAGIGASATEFGTTLKALEGTFTKTTRRPWSTVVEVSFSNASVRDFLMGRLADNPGELAMLIDGCAHFGQLRLLARLADTERADTAGRPADRLAVQLASLKNKLIGRMNGLLYSPPSETDTAQSPRHVLVERALLLRRTFGAEAFTRQAALDLSSALASAWTGEQSMTLADVKIVKALAAMSSDDEISEAAAGALKSIALSGAFEAADFQAALALSAVRGLFDEGEIYQLHAEFDEFVEQELSRLEDLEPEDPDDLESMRQDAEELRSACQEYGSIDFRVDDIDTRIEELGREFGSGPDEDHEPDHRRSPSEAMDRNEIDRLFDRLR